MIFTSYDFLIFFLIVFGLYWLARRRQWQNIILLAASYLFYGWIHPWYAALLGLSTLADFGLALGIARHKERSRLTLTLSLLLNLGILATFKYYNFFSESLVAALSGLGIRADALLVNVLLPAGLSFYTLKKLAYIIDVSRGDLEPTRDLVGFALFVGFFPQLNAGPIDRAQKLLPQIQSDRAWKSEYFYSAWPLLVMGFFKKIVIADTVRVFVDRVYNLKEPTGFLLLAATLGFTLQILADFTAYTDLARALARLFGFDTSENFRLPYLALTPTDFWNRWHITLSTWLRDYVFFPLRRALLRANLPRGLTDAIPPLVTMFLSGLWHGAGWTYVVWGLYFGVLIVLYQLLGFGGAWQPANKFSQALAWTVMFTLIVISFAIFRSPSLGWLGSVLANGPFLGSLDHIVMGIVTLALIGFYAAPLFVKMAFDKTFTPDSIWHTLYYVGAVIAMLAYLNTSSPDFIYFQF
ncbi:MAG: MBOAT family protein [Chloroflexi bacterium]|nr:MBOAT family protein [Chloroflexota bacterium]